MLQELLEPLGNLTVLIVEDDPLALELLETPLARRCHKVYTCKKGDQGLKIFKKNPIDVVISDISLEGKMDGIEMVQAIRKISPNVPVIFMTAYSDEDKLTKIVELNSAAFIKKPIDLEELFVVLLNINRQLHKDTTTNLGKGIFYRRKDKAILKGYAIFELTDREISILELLLKREGEAIPYEDFQAHVWKEGKMTMDSLRMHINSLRRKTYYDMIKNHSRIGYKLHIAPEHKK